MNKTISWDEAFKLVQNCVAVLIDSHSHTLVYPLCFTNEQNEGDGANIELRPNFHKIEDVDMSKIVSLRNGMILIDADMNDTVEVCEHNNLIFKDDTGSKVEIILLARMLIK